MSFVLGGILISCADLNWWCSKYGWWTMVENRKGWSKMGKQQNNNLMPPVRPATMN